MIRSEILETGEQARQRIRTGQWLGPTAGLAPGFVQANLVILPERWAQDFLRFCQLNPRPMPILEVLGPGNPHPQRVAHHADLRTDLPRYRVYREGKMVDEPTDLRHLWQPDWVAFLLGCSFTTEHQLVQQGVRVRHIEQGQNVPMYKTRWLCKPGGRFRGPLVVSMRPIARKHVARSYAVTSRFPLAHGAPVHWGDASRLGIKDLSAPDYGEPIKILDDEIPVFWACGVTPQAALAIVQPEIAVTHAPGHMFITNWKDTDIDGKTVDDVDQDAEDFSVWEL